MAKPLPVIKITALAKHHGRFLIAIGTALMLVTLMLSQYFWQQQRLPLIFLILVALILIFTGVLKELEPKHSVLLSPKGIKYQHKYGQWHLTWQQIQKVSQIKETTGLTLLNLPYIGIRLHNLESFAQQISPRLANRLIHEQKPLIAFALMHQLLSLEQSQLNFSPYKLSTGQLLKGPLAAFLYHCQALHTGFGYHLVIPQNSVDRELNDFCQLLSQCQQSAGKYL